MITIKKISRGAIAWMFPLETPEDVYQLSYKVHENCIEFNHP